MSSNDYKAGEASVDEPPLAQSVIAQAEAAAASSADDAKQV